MRRRDADLSVSQVSGLLAESYRFTRDHFRRMCFFSSHRDSHRTAASKMAQNLLDYLWYQLKTMVDGENVRPSVPFRIHQSPAKDDNQNINGSLPCNGYGGAVEKVEGDEVSRTGYPMLRKPEPGEIPKPPPDYSGKLIGIDGGWYDVTDFIAVHPGGKVIEKFVGKDATPLFRGMHEMETLGGWKPVAHYQMPTFDPAYKAFYDLHTWFYEQGFFKANYSWYAMKMAWVVALIGVSAIFAIQGQWYIRLLGSLSLYMVFQQSGFLMHDTMHTQLTKNPSIDRIFGTLFGTVFMGASGHWWKDDHFEHHALTNTLSNTLKENLDPQMGEDIWVQNHRLFFMFTSRLLYFFIKLQWIWMLPLSIAIGRWSMIVDAFLVTPEKRWYEWLALGLHFSWLLPLLSLLPSWQEALLFYSITSWLEGFFHVQLIISHYSKPFFTHEEMCEEESWYRIQIEGNVNIDNPIYTDFYHGGLNFHVEHHLFPRLPRHNLRRASYYVKKTCRELGIFYDEQTFWQAHVSLMTQMKKMAQIFQLPRMY